MSTAGLFTSNSVAWRLHAHPSAMVSGIRSLIVQALNPRAMAAVSQHSDFNVDFWGRLRRTSDFVLTVVYGSEDVVRQAAAGVRAVHARIEGVDDFTGSPYRADDPELLRWIHNATVESYLVGYRLYGGPLSSDEADQYVHEMRVLGQLMGLDIDDVAQNESGLRQYFDEQRPQLVVSPNAKVAVRRLLVPDMPLWLRPLWSVPAAAAMASLPTDYRRAYGLPWIAPLQPGIRVSTLALITGLRLLLPPPPLVEEAMRAETTRV